MQITLTDIEREAYKESLLHNMDGRVKIIMTLAVIIYSVSLPRLDVTTIERLGVLWLYLIALMAAARLNPAYAAARLALALPFGLSVSFLQPFIRQSFIHEFTVIYWLPAGITMTLEGTLFGAVLLSKFMVCVTSVVLLSSTTQMQDMVSSARRLGLPGELALLFSMMIRYLFVFWSMLRRIRTAQQTRCFDIWNRQVPRRWILEQIGHSISALFIRSYEQGERTYQSMLCRAYSADSHIYAGKHNVGKGDCVVFSGTIVLIFALHFFI